MLEHVMLREQFQTLLNTQQAALGQYQTAAQTADPESKAKLDQLCREKLRHVELTQRLLEIVEE